MRRFLGAVCVTLLVCGPGNPARAADDKDAQAIVDKGIQALGGADKLGSLKAASWKSKGTLTINDTDNTISSQVTVEGLDHSRREFEGEFNGNTVKGLTVVDGDKGWRKFGDNSEELDKEGLANEKRGMYLQWVPVTLVPLKGKGFKVEAAGEEKVGDKPAVVLKVTGPDGKDFKLSFDKESGLPVKMVAKVAGFMGGEFEQETTYSNYKDFGGVKKATKVSSKRDGQKFLEQDISDFKALDKVDPKTFAEPQ
jgi:hypothetical protein